jgi:two-component system sensor histidine kinase PilS (NtrC family)
MNIGRAAQRATSEPVSEGPASAHGSWFGAFDSAVGEDAVGDSAFTVREAVRADGVDDHAPASPSRARDERVGAAQGARDRATPGGFQRIYRAFVTARAGIGLMLVAIQGLAAVLAVQSERAVLALCAAYALQAVTVWLLPRLRRVEPAAASRLSRTQITATIGVDVVAFSALHLLSGNTSLNYTALLGLPVLMAGVLTPRPLALATAAAATLLLLADAGWTFVFGRETSLLLTQAALLGGGFFVMALLAAEMANRIAREEMSARGSLELARQQAQLNRLVLEEMQDGVLVVDRRGRVRAANPAARLLLAAEGMCPPAPFQLQGIDAWRPVVQAVERAFSESHWPEGGRDVTLDFAADRRRTLRVRVRFTRRRDAEQAEELCVLFLEDLRMVHERLRQEKLAAMGRVSAGIAHEIRNPLAAIAQANALLAEDATEPAQRRLAQMVSDNVERLKRIVDDVMELAPGAQPAASVIDATAVVGTVAGDWAATAGLKLGEHSLMRVELPGEALGVAFDAEHLRRVLVNLLDNALRHASGEPGSARLVLAPRGTQAVVLSVANDGPIIAADVEPHLFEPFFSTRSRGTGLGLYICRELCERYGASIDYRRLGEDVKLRNEFIVVMHREPLMSAEHQLPLHP